MTPAQIQALGPVPSDAELITLYRYALANGWAGTTRTVGGPGGNRSVTFASPKELLDMIERLEIRVADNEDDDKSNGGVALAVFLPPR